VALRRRPIDVTGLVQQFLKLEAQFGEPLDIEWALSAGKLYILQARPIVNDTAGPSRAPVAAKIKKPNTFPVGSSLRR
jgi:phosphoenolpyruvate synthase/pyruvate phosphate dikinase